ncbi:MAG: 3-dehydroquinate synthase [Blautia sp.]|nr:3-dehydroquinate synthase [Blautia sp.]
MQRIEVRSKLQEEGFSYPIYFTKGFSDLLIALKETGLTGRRFCVVTDSNVAPLYLKALEMVLSKAGVVCASFVLEAGEEHKTLSAVQQLYEHLIREGMDRKGMLCALGGGVTGDLTGFAAATYLRGIDFIQIPTTLLAQVDSSVGGKTGVDFLQYKNMVGAFHQPRLVYMNMDTLATLDEDQFSCGMGEVLKTGLLADGAFYRDICGQTTAVRKRDPDLLQMIIRGCCHIKAEIVEEDPKEQGKRALLNLGHTVGHAVEKLKDFTLLHGQCVAIGLVAAARISLNRDLLTRTEFDEIRSGLVSFGLPVKVEGLTREEILAAMKKDKKKENGRIKFILPDGIGKAIMETGLSEEELAAGIDEILEN